MFNPSREQARQFLAEAWRKRRDRLPATALETIAGDIVSMHPEYHALLDAPDKALQREWLPEHGETNPFLHLSLHLAIEEQLSINQPPGIVVIYNKLLAQRGDRHEALHIMLEGLAETLWRSQRDQKPLDGAAYLELLQRAAE
ncbi:conserved protein of unknown function [Georgfuchsia toluolica]|uniref:DUF1841 family protein n=1 Tax=Georgfuchsia toluolica TaxID=424218 RepID=A0A916N1A1_9PROT|nr:DUF1841 family protein [Georgfuchsia toluolica]CAG4882425.1 conserved protein of unknown function [Georgfuchsia toluolica]